MTAEVFCTRTTFLLQFHQPQKQYLKTEGTTTYLHTQLKTEADVNSSDEVNNPPQLSISPAQTIPNSYIGAPLSNVSSSWHAHALIRYVTRPFKLKYRVS